MVRPSSRSRGRRAGGTLGIAVLGSLFAEIYAAGVAARLSGLVPAEALSTAAGSVAAAGRLARAETSAGLGASIEQGATAAFLTGFEVTLAFSALVCLAGLLLALRTIPASSGTAAAEVIDGG